MPGPASWDTWAHAARELDECHLAVALRDTKPGAADDLERAHVLVLAGRAREALASLARLGVVPPTGEEPTWAQAVLAGAHAALGDADAYAWLLRVTAGAGPDAATSGLARLVAAASDQRGDTAVADRAWLDLVAARGRYTRTSATRAAVALVARRAREASPRALCETVAAAGGLLSRPDDAGSSHPSLSAARKLEVRGDVAGARLLLRAVTAVGPTPPAVREALRSSVRAVPLWSRLASPALFVACVLVGAAATFLTGVRALSVAAVGLGALAHARATWRGFSRAEMAAWHVLATVRWDEGTGQVETEDTSARGWYGLAGVLGAVVGMVVAVVVADPATTTAVAPGAAFALWVSVVAACSVLAVWGARRVHRMTLHRRGRRRRAEAHEATLLTASACACWSSSWFVGPMAAAYAREHLEPVGSADTSGIPVRAEVARCPATGVPWFVGPVADDSSWLALRGAPSDAVAPAATTPTRDSSGFYL